MFGLLTHQFENFNRIGFENAAETSQAKMDKDFGRKELGKGHHTTDGDDFYKQSKCELETNDILKKELFYKPQAEEYTQASVLIESYYTVHLFAGKMLRKWKQTIIINLHHRLQKEEQ